MVKTLEHAKECALTNLRCRDCEIFNTDAYHMGCYTESRKMVYEALENADKYKWHYDPCNHHNDLPEVGENIIIAELYVYPSRHFEYHSVTMNERQECITADDDFLMDIDDVYAWRYFEEVE